MNLIKPQREVNLPMSKNAYEIRLDILAIAHQYETQLFSERVKQLKEGSKEDIQKLYPTRETILKTAELFYSFVSDNTRSYK
jgi:DNA invertase Pin-like site-specific DNA recombinase